MHIKICLKDCLKHHKYNWPVTMLSYPIVFEEAVAENSWDLKNERGDSVPFQVTEKEKEGDLVKSLTLNFLSGLQSGECKTYFFDIQDENIGICEERKFDAAFDLEIEKKNSSFTVKYKDKKMVCQIPFEALQYHTVHSGCIFEEVEIVCEGKEEQKYILNVRRIAEMPFWELKETMSNFNEEKQAKMKISFEGFSFSHRHSWGRPVEKIDAFLREENKLPIVVMPYENWVPWFQTKYIAFLGEEHSAGLFIRDNQEWNDGKYPIWGANRDFGISFNYDSDSVTAYFPIKNGNRFVAITAFKGCEEDYVEYLWKWYAYFHLNKVKNWILEWEEEQNQFPKFFSKEQAKPIQATGGYYKRGDMLQGSKMTEVIDELSLSINRANYPVYNREFADWTVIIDLTADEMTKEEFERTKSWFAFMAYACMDENYMPTKNMLAGHPNFLADTASVAGFFAAVFPNHPEREVFRQYFNKTVSLNLKYHIRPDVAAYGSLGGRETESIGGYCFAMLRPYIHVCKLYVKCGYSIPLVCKNGAKWLNWMTNCMSAPVDGRRTKPPQGAHARKIEIPYILYEFAQLLEKDYSEIARNTYAVCVGNPLGNFEVDSIEDDIWRTLLRREDDGGTLLLKSEKFTGYGCVLREAVGTSDEISVHIQQLDLGPNYRWGCFENTGNGGIHYFAAGKRYSFNTSEGTGDRDLGAEEGNCGFAVLREHTYHNIGFQDLTEPLYDFPMTKQIKLLAGNNIKDFYKYRRVSLVEKDYVVIFDAVTHMRAKGRFLWTVNKLEEFPKIWQILPGAAGTFVKEEKEDFVSGNGDAHHIEFDKQSKSVAYDGYGNFLTIVSHKEDMNVQKKEYGAIIDLPLRQDYVFEDAALIRFYECEITFIGYSGVISISEEGIRKGALLEGREIGCDDLNIRLKGKGAIYFEGKVKCWRGTIIADRTCRVCINGKEISVEKGKYDWEFGKEVVINKIPDLQYDDINGFVRDTRRHEFGFAGYDFNDCGEILTYPENL